jgi:PAT family beta-lactamase induction signal transducer AmpG
MPWSTVYLIMACTLGACTVITLFAPEPPREPGEPRSLKEAVIEPLKDFFLRPGAWGILAFILFYKIGDNMAAALTVKFIKDLGYSNTDLATLQKVFGMISLLLGGILGGAWVLKMGLYRSLWVFGVFQSISTFGFSILNHLEHTKTALAIVIGIENFSTGMGTAAYSGFIAALCNRKFTATQFALLTSLMAVSRTIFTAPSGMFVEWMGWSSYFIFCGLIAAPGLIILTRFKKSIETY